MKTGNVISLVIAFFLFINLACFSEDTKTPATTETKTVVKVSPLDVNETPSFPYVAQITGENVYIRSGPGTNYYTCGKINQNDIVKVIAQKYSWSCIVPPPGSFSWVSKQYVQIDEKETSVGLITGDRVNVRAGSDDGNPLHSSVIQGQLERGDKVKLTGEEQNDYYKIYPPAFAYLWVSSQFIKPLGSYSGIVDINIPEKADSNAAGLKPAETRDLQQYYALQALVKAELEKPLLEQNFSKVKEALAVIAAKKESGKAARYAEFTLKRIEGYELAAKVNKAIQAQDKQLAQAKESIQKAAETKSAELPNLGRFAVIGTILPSSAFGSEAILKHYKVVDSAGLISCYALPASNAPTMDLSKFMGKKVGLVGTIEPNPETMTALVRFMEIFELK